MAATVTIKSQALVVPPMPHVLQSAIPPRDDTEVAMACELALNASTAPGSSFRKELQILDASWMSMGAFHSVLVVAAGVNLYAAH
eukprot:1695968-Amphidinium_carterae.1